MQSNQQFRYHNLDESNKLRLVNEKQKIRNVMANYQASANIHVPMKPFADNDEPDPFEISNEECTLSMQSHYLKSKATATSKPQRVPISNRIIFEHTNKRFRISQKLENYVFGTRKINKDDSLSTFDLMKKKSLGDLNFESKSPKLNPNAIRKMDYINQKAEIQVLSKKLKQRGLQIDEDVLERALLRPKEQISTPRKIPRNIKANQVPQLKQESPLSAKNTAQSIKILQQSPSDDIALKPSTIRKSLTLKKRQKGTIMTLVATPAETQDLYEDGDVLVKVDSWWSQGIAKTIKSQTIEKKILEDNYKQQKASEPIRRYGKMFGHVESSLIVQKQQALERIKSDLNSKEIPWPRIESDRNLMASKTTPVCVYESVVLSKMIAEPPIPDLKVEHIVISTMNAKYKPYLI